LLPPLRQVPPRSPKLKPLQLSTIHSLSPPFLWSHYSAPSACHVHSMRPLTTDDLRRRFAAGSTYLNTCSVAWIRKLYPFLRTSLDACIHACD